MKKGMLAKRWTIRMDGVPLPLSMRATTLWVVPMRAATSFTKPLALALGFSHLALAQTPCHG